VAFVLLPGVDEVPQQAVPGVVAARASAGALGATFPPSVLWRFRIGALAVQAVVWLGSGLAFGWSLQRAHPVDPATGHGFIGSQAHGREVFAAIEED